MKLIMVDRSYQSLDENTTYKVSYGPKGVQIVIEQASGVFMLTLDEAKILVPELRRLIDAAEEWRSEDFNENP